MKPFDYYAASSIQEACALLSQQNLVVQPLAGGTDLLVQLRHDLKQVDAVVDIKKIPELNQLTYDTKYGLTVGASVSCAKLCTHQDVQSKYPCLVDAAGIIGGSAIQERASLGGNLCNAAPSGDSIPAMIVLRAECSITNGHVTKVIPVEDICTNPGETVLQKGDLLVSIHFPVPPANSGGAYLRFTPRREMDIAVAGAGAWVHLNEDHSEIIDARIALSAVAPTPLQVHQAASVLSGLPPDESSVIKAAEAAQTAARPISDMRGTAMQRQHLVGILVKRALRLAIQRAAANTE